MPAADPASPAAPATPPTAREAAKARRRVDLLAAAARLFAARGFDAVRLEDIGAAVGISGPAIYRHFAGKAAVLTAILDTASQDLLDGGLAAEAQHAPVAGRGEVNDGRGRPVTGAPGIQIGTDRQPERLGGARLLLAHLVPARIVPPRPRRTLPHLVQHSQARAAHARSTAPTCTAPHRVDARLRRLHDAAILLGHEMKVAAQRMRRM